MSSTESFLIHSSLSHLGSTAKTQKTRGLIPFNTRMGPVQDFQYLATPAGRETPTFTNLTHEIIETIQANTINVYFYISLPTFHQIVRQSRYNELRSALEGVPTTKQLFSVFKSQKQLAALCRTMKQLYNPKSAFFRLYQ